MAGTQQIKEVQPALRRAVPNQVNQSLPICVQKPFLPAWRAPVSSTETNGEVCNPARKMSCASLTKPICLVDQQALQQTLRDRYANRTQQRHQPRQCGLPLMILHQHEAAEFGTEMTIDPFWQRCQDGASIRRDPAFALVTGRAR